MLNEYVVEARLAELRREAIRANIERAVRELYSDSPRTTPNIDPALYARYVWNGFHG